LAMATVSAAYIGALLLYANKLPCTCIGLFENMTWTWNLVFNAGLMITALAGILLHGQRTVRQRRIRYLINDHRPADRKPAGAGNQKELKSVHAFQRRMPGHSMTFADTEFMSATR